jgi:light-regulated signal transduction histidine kinase (bacteriophytochrome)
MRPGSRRLLLALGAALSGGAAALAWSRVAPAGADAWTGPLVAAAIGASLFVLGALVSVWSSPAAALAAAEAGRDAARRDADQGRAELDAFQHAVAHDLRSPIGAVLNFTSVLEQDHGGALDAGGKQILARIRRSAASGLSLLDALSRLSRVTRAPLRPEPVDVEALVRRIFAEARPPGSPAELSVGSLPVALGDAALLQTAFEELLSNAVKFSGDRDKPHVAVGGRSEPDGSLVYWVGDDGVGFDMRFAGRLFGVFERLHSREEFPGAGVGLACVRRIAERHGGRVWAEGEPDRGARMFLALPQRPGGGA